MVTRELNGSWHAMKARYQKLKNTGKKSSVVREGMQQFCAAYNGQKKHDLMQSLFEVQTTTTEEKEPKLNLAQDEPEEG